MILIVMVVDLALEVVVVIEGLPGVGGGVK